MPVKSDGAAVTLCVFAQQVLDEAGIVSDTLFIAVVTVDEHHEMGGAEGHFRPFVVAGGCAHTSLGITIDGQSCDIEHTTSDAFIRFSLPTYTQGEGVAHELVGIEASDAVAIGDGGEVDGEW